MKPDDFVGRFVKLKMQLASTTLPRTVNKSHNIEEIFLIESFKRNNYGKVDAYVTSSDCEKRIIYALFESGLEHYFEIIQ